MYLLHHSWSHLLVECMIYTNSYLLEYEWSVRRSRLFFLIVLSEIQLKIWWRMATNTENNVFTFLQMLFVNKFYVSLIAFPLSPIKQLGKSLLLRSLFFFHGILGTHIFPGRACYTVLGDILYRINILPCMQNKIFGGGYENISIYMMK